MRAKFAPLMLLLAGLGQIAWAQQDRPPPTRALPPGDPLRPIMATHTILPYPPESVAAKEQGTSLVEVYITTAGTVDNCSVFQSSGYPRLDQAACDYIQNTWRWQPTLNGEPTAARTRISITWHLPPSVPLASPLRPIAATHTIPPYPPDSFAAEEQGTSVVEVHITTDGKVDSCSVFQSSGYPRLDQAACDHIASVWRWQPPTTLDGQPTTVRTRISLTWNIKDAPPPQ